MRANTALALGVELGSTRIKGVLADAAGAPRKASEFQWENRLEGGLYTYGLEEARRGSAKVCRELGLGEEGLEISAMGVSAMMHGYLALDKGGNLLVPFRTWRNESTGEAAKKLSDLFGVNIPLRWSVAHLYQAILGSEAHVKKIARLTTLAGYVHFRLTGRMVLGAGDASGMFPLEGLGWDPEMLRKFLDLTGIDFAAIAPEPLPAGAEAGRITEAGAAYLGAPKAIGIPLCPPEGDAGTGMVATNSLSPKMGNVSAGTSIFAMVVLEKPLKTSNPAIDVVATPDGAPVAMVHYNECASKIDPWIGLFGEAAAMFGEAPEKGELYRRLYEKALEATPLGLFMRERLTGALGELSEGLSALTQGEGVAIEGLTGHGGYFKSGDAGRVVMSEALGIPVRLLAHAGEGGAWGAAILAGYLASGAGEPLPKYVNALFEKGGRI